MKTMFTAAFLTFGISLGAGATPASADALSALESACRTGVYSACSKYNAAIIARSAGQNPVLTQGFSPFNIIPASHVERAPKAAEAAARGTTTPKADAVATIAKASR